LRVDSLIPALPRLFSGGPAARGEVGRAGRLVQGSLGLGFGELPVVGFMLVVGFMPVVWRALDLLGQIWRHLGVTLLFEVLRWSELKTVGRSSSMDSSNKAHARGGGLGGRGGDGGLHLRRRGADMAEGYSDDAVLTFSWSRGRLKLLFGDIHTVAMASHRDLWPSRRPLQTPMMALGQPLVWRPFHGFSPAIIRLVAPSGAVPGSGEGGQRWSLSFGGGVKGLDCFFCTFCRVLSTYSGDCFVIYFSAGVLCNLYPHRQH